MKEYLVFPVRAGRFHNGSYYVDHDPIPAQLQAGDVVAFPTGIMGMQPTIYVLTRCSEQGVWGRAVHAPTLGTVN